MDEFKTEFARLRRHLVSDLRQIASIQGQYFLSPGAFQWGHDWYKSHWDVEANDHLDREMHGGYLARKQTHIHKVAMILVAATTNEMVITERHLAQADFLVSQLEDQMINVFRHISDNRDAMLASQMLEMLRVRGEYGIPKRDLWRLMIHRCSYDEFERATKGLIIAGLILEYSQGSTVKYRLAFRETAREGSVPAGEIIARWESLAREGSLDDTSASDSASTASRLSPEPDQAQNH